MKQIKAGKMSDNHPRRQNRILLSAALLISAVGIALVQPFKKDGWLNGILSSFQFFPEDQMSWSESIAEGYKAIPIWENTEHVSDVVLDELSYRLPALYDDYRQLYPSPVQRKKLFEITSAYIENTEIRAAALLENTGVSGCPEKTKFVFPVEAKPSDPPEVFIIKQEIDENNRLIARLVNALANQKTAEQCIVWSIPAEAGGPVAWDPRWNRIEFCGMSTFLKKMVWLLNVKRPITSQRLLH